MLSQSPCPSADAKTDGTAADAGRSGISPELELRSLRHQYANEMQLILALLEASVRKAPPGPAKELMREATDRVGIVAASLASASAREAGDLEAGIRWLCGKFGALCPDIQLVLTAEGEPPQLRAGMVAAILLAVNELVTNAVKHGFPPDGRRGVIRIRLCHDRDRALSIFVEDDGPLTPPSALAFERRGSGLELVRRLIASKGGLFIMPEPGSKRFEIRFPIGR